MKDMPLPFEFQGKGVFDFSSALVQQHKWNKEGCYQVGTSEPTSVLDTRRSPSPPTSSSTLTSSFGSGSIGSTALESGSIGSTALESGSSGVAAVAGSEKCGLGMEDWENVLSEFASSPSRDQSMLRYIMGDIEDPVASFNKLLQGGAPPPELEFHGGGSDFGNLMGAIDPCLNEPVSGFQAIPNPSFSPTSVGNTTTLLSTASPPGVRQPPFQSLEVKPQIFNSQLITNQPPSHNPAMFMPLSFIHQDRDFLLPPPEKRLNTGVLPCSDSGQGQDPYVRRLQSQGFPHQLQLLPNHLQPRPIKPKMVGDEMEMVQHQQAIIEQIFKAVELVEMGNSVLAQGILARLNHQLSPIGKPFQRVAFYFKESLQLLLLHMNNNTTTTITPTSSSCSPFSLIFKIGAYKSFSEVSPLVQFANFTCNQALLESLEGFDRIHIIDFDIGYGGQWASLMQELALRNGGAPSLKITAFASPSAHDELELGLTRENLNHFASEVNMAFEIEVVSFDSLNSIPPHLSNNEAVAVNLPIGSLLNYPLSLSLVLRFVKQLSPKIVVSLDRGCDRIDLPFPHHVITAIQSYWSLLESLDAVNVNLDALQKIERFLLQPGIEKIVMGRHLSLEKTPHWRTIFLSSGFTPLQFSNFTESQADCLVHRTPVRGFHIEKKQSSLVLCWQQKELISASAWRC